MSEPPQCVCVWESAVRRIGFRLNDNKVSEWLRSCDHSLMAAALQVPLAFFGPNREAIVAVDRWSADLDRCPVREELVSGKIIPYCCLSAMSINLSGRSLQPRFSGALTYLYYSSTGAAFLAMLLGLRDQE